MTKRLEILFGIVTADGAHRAMAWDDGAVIFKGRPYANRQIAAELSRVLRRASDADGETGDEK